MNEFKDKIVNLCYTTFLFTLAIACWIMGVQIGDKTNGTNFGLLFIGAGTTYLTNSTRSGQKTNVEAAGEVNVGETGK